MSGKLGCVECICDDPITVNNRCIYCGSTLEVNANKPRTVASVLLERWAQDTEAMARDLMNWRRTSVDRVYALEPADAIKAEVAYLNSAAEGK